MVLGLLAVVLTVLTAYSVSHVRSALGSLTTVFEDRVVPLRQLQRVARSHEQTLVMVQQVRDGLLVPERAVEALRAAGELSRREWADYLTTYLVPDEVTLIAQAQPLLARGDAAREQVIALIQAGDRAGLAAYATDGLHGATQPLAQVLGRLVDLQVVVAQRELIASRRAYERVLWITFGAATLALVAGSALIWWTALRYGRERLAEQQAAQRQARFYAALSHTNQLIVRVRDERTLYDETCRICVDTGQAVLACMWQLDVASGTPVPVASYGPMAHQLGEPPACGGVVLAALRDQQSVIGNDRLGGSDNNGPSTQRPGPAPEALSVAAFPIWRGGKVESVLALYVLENDLFDAPLLALMAEMAGDLGFALDSIDRDAKHAAVQLALAENEARLNGIVESALDAVISIDARRHIVLFNEAAGRMLRVAPQAAIGTCIDRFVPPERMASDHAFFDAYSRGQHPGFPQGQAQRLVALRADGERFPIALTMSRSGEGERMLMTLWFNDLTDALEAEKAREAGLAAEAASRAKTEFLSHMSHELRTPLNAVLGFSQILQNDEVHPLSPHQQPQVEAIRQAGWHLLSLINDVLDISRIESGRLQVQARGVLLSSAVNEVVPMVRAQAAAAGVHVEIASFPQPSPRAWCDPLRLRQVLVNLLSNAVKYNRPGGLVRISAQAGQPMLCLQVSDTGQGMSPEQLRHLFEPFNRLGRERGLIEGTGIGMALARQLIELMQGRVEVDSRVGVGTTVRVFLPAAHEGDAAAGDVSGGSSGGSPEQATEPCGTVLYVEDNAVNVIVVEQMLSRWRRVSFVHAEDGAQGIELARRLKPDLVLLDMRLPDMDGPEVLHALQADPATRGLRVVALSASAMPDEVDAARAGGAFDYWTKPLDFDHFLDAMRGLLSPA